MFRLLSFLFYFLGLGPVIFNLDAFQGFPWDQSRSFDSNIEPYISICVSIFMLVVIRSVMEPLAKNEGGYKDCTEKARGFIRDISHSPTRINNSPRFKALVFYSGIEKEFDLLPEAFQFNFEVGDEVVIRHHPEDENNSTLDFNLSLAKKEEAQVQ
jgi:hypothetical protein